MSISNNIQFYDLHTGKVVPKLGISFKNTWIGKIQFDKYNDSLIEVSTVKGRYTVNFQKAEIVQSSNFKLDEVVHKLLDSTELIVTRNYIRKLKNDRDVDLKFVEFDNLVGAEMYRENNLLITLSNSNEISFYRIDNLNKFLIINPKFNNEWITFNPAGYFVSSPKGDEKVYWSLGDRQLEFSDLSYKFNRPNLITETLSRIGNKDSVEQISQVTTESFSPYTVKLDPECKTGMSKSRYYRLKMQISKANKDVAEPTVLVKLSGKAQKYSIQNLDPTTRVLMSDLVLNDGDSNDIQIFLASKYVAYEYYVYCSEQGIPEQNLWFLGIGVGTYLDSTRVLSFAKKDITDVCNVLKNQEKIRYNHVFIDTLFDSNAGQDSVSNHLHDIMLNVQPSDVLVVYVSGHGVEYGDEFYLMRSSADWQKPDVGNTDINRIWDVYLKKRLNQSVSKTFLWLDMCSSAVIGNVGKPEFNFNMDYGSMSAFAATTANGEAKESKKYGNGGNGAFTAAMIEGMNCQADMKQSMCEYASGNCDSIVTVKELYDYVAKRVYKLTGKQIPEIGIQIGRMDCDITRYKICK